MVLQIVQVIKYWSQGEITNFIKVWISVFASLFYCFFLTKIIPKGFTRLFAITPVILLNLILPSNLHTLHLGVSSAFFLAWLANFKLLMFAFGYGPLSDPSISFPTFVSLACLPIKSSVNEKSNSKTSKQGLNSWWSYVVKALLVFVIVKSYSFSDLIHPKFTWALYCFHIYFGLEIILALVGGLAKVIVGIELEPQFDEPYFSTSLQQFWGRRWNIMVTRILRPTVYDPILNISKLAIGPKLAPLPAVLSAFFVSALMHELIFFYMGRRKPSGEITLFFMLHGVLIVIEVAVKRAFKGRLQLHWMISMPLTVATVLLTSFWLFFPEFLKCNSVDRAFDEYEKFGAFIKDVGEVLVFKSFNSSSVE